ncbi:MAG: 4-hydroxybenzoate octaprenyltransferase [Deltaproteobacteria bacterium]|nr:4-hydroxybenzoate octaprenyltransferase [Deltaproteobacteria bacterium]
MDKIIHLNTSFFNKMILTLKMIKVQHSIFALPFAVSSCLVAFKGIPPLLFLFMICLAMVTARNAAMSFNRIVDVRFDRLNPRTKDRELPSGQLSVRFAVIFCIINSILFIAISFYFNMLTFILSPLALIIILGYSLTKRWTAYTQIFLGLALGIAPIAAWIASIGTLAPYPFLLGTAVFAWVAGFDVIYSTLDYEHDKKHNINSFVVKQGIKGALLVSVDYHIFSIIFLIFSGVLQGLSFFYFLGIVIMAGLLVYEHSLIKPHDLSKVNTAFFTLNGYVSMVFLVFVCLEVLL